MLRTIVSIAFLALATLFIVADFIFELSEKVGDLFLNLGSEMIGIAATVAIVEWFFEQREKEDSIRKVAQRALHEIDHAVWVWQGGARTYNIAELRILVLAIGDSDPIPPFTETLFLHIGSKATNTIRENKDVQARERLREAFSRVAFLAEIREWNHLNDNGTPSQPPQMIRQCLLDVLPVLCAFAKEVWPADSGIEQPGRTAGRDTSVDAQEWRHFGKPRRERFDR